MEIVDNGVMLAVPGAMDAGLANALFWGALGFALVVAFAFAYPVNRYLIAERPGARGRAWSARAGGRPAGGAGSERQFVLIGVAAIVVTLLVTVGAALLVGG